MIKVEFPRPAKVGEDEVEIHYGYEFTVDKDGKLVAELSNEVAKIEINAGRLNKAEDKTNDKGKEK